MAKPGRCRPGAKDRNRRGKMEGRSGRRVGAGWSGVVGRQKTLPGGHPGRAGRVLERRLVGLAALGVRSEEKPEGAVFGIHDAVMKARRRRTGHHVDEEVAERVVQCRDGLAGVRLDYRGGLPGEWRGAWARSWVGPVQRWPLALKLRALGPATMMWSRTDMPRVAAAAVMLAVMSMSARDGVGSPEG